MNPETILLAVIDALAAADVPYLLAGSFSSNYYGIPRSTQDADFVIELQGRSVMSLQPHLGPSLRVDPQVGFETVTGTRRNVVTIRRVLRPLGGLGANPLGDQPNATSGR